MVRYTVRELIQIHNNLLYYILYPLVALVQLPYGSEVGLLFFFFSCSALITFSLFCLASLTGLFCSLFCPFILYQTYFFGACPALRPFPYGQGRMGREVLLPTLSLQVKQKACGQDCYAEKWLGRRKTQLRRLKVNKCPIWSRFCTTTQRVIIVQSRMLKVAFNTGLTSIFALVQ